MDLSIIIANCNTRNLLKQCLESIYNNFNGYEFEIIVVDNASYDDSINMLETHFLSVKCIKNNKNLGYSMANNQGIKESRGRYILILNSDILILENSINEAIRYLDTHQDVGILGPKLIGNENKIIQMSWGWHPSLFGELIQKIFSPPRVQKYKFIRNIVGLLQKNEKEVPFVTGASMFIRRSALDDFKPFDENIVLFFEEPDICLRAWKNGWKVVFYPKSEIIHLLGKSAAREIRKISLIYRQSQLYFYKKNNPKYELSMLKFYLSLKFLSAFILNYLTGSKRNYIDKCFLKDLFDILFGKLRISL